MIFEPLRTFVCATRVHKSATKATSLIFRGTTTYFWESCEGGVNVPVVGTVKADASFPEAVLSTLSTSIDFIMKGRSEERRVGKECA